MGCTMSHWKHREREMMLGLSCGTPRRDIPSLENGKITSLHC